MKIMITSFAVVVSDLFLIVSLLSMSVVNSWTITGLPKARSLRPSPLFEFTERQETSAVLSSINSETDQDKAEVPLPYDYLVPEDAVVHIKPSAMKRLRELRDQRRGSSSQSTEPLILRMGVRSGGCSGMSYVMDFTTQDGIQEDDAVDVYEEDQIQCVVDAKSMLYLYGLELDYSDKLIGGGFKFYNPNAEESCGCGSSFGV